jgi:hypothetical protein
LPPKLASHLNDFSLPTSIKTALHGFVRATGPVSFKSVASGKTDFLLVFPDTSVNTAYSMRLKEDTPLYSFNGIGTAYDFVERSVDLVETMEAWEKRYSISLNLFLMPGPTSNSSKP